MATSPEGLSLNHRKHVLDILKDVGLSNAKPNATPFPKRIKLIAKKETYLRSHNTIGNLLEGFYI